MALLDDAGMNEQRLIRSQSVQQEPDHGVYLTDIDAEPVDEEILEPQNEALSERVYEELSYREQVLGNLYPFVLSAEYGKWTLQRRVPDTDAERASHDCYICCLLIAAIHSELLPTKTNHDIFKASAKTMQIASFLTAAEILGGRAYWFGFPRPDGTGMLSAIQGLVKEMGTGIAPIAKPTGLSSHAADGTVDIVAWRPFLDGQPASIVAYGQVASGRNWKTKPIKSFIEGHFLPWFVKTPSHKHIEMLFVPILQHHELGESRKENFRTVATEQARFLENDFGIVIDRLRLTELMALSKINGRYDKKEYEEYEAEALSWIADATAYASGREVAAA